MIQPNPQPIVRLVQTRSGRIGSSLVLIALAHPLWILGQVSTSVSTSRPAQYLTPSTVPATLRGPLAALGDRLQTPGRERLTLIGTFTDSKGSQPIQFTWELPGKIRIDFAGPSARSIIFDGGISTSSIGSPSSADDDLMESLADDRAETLLYGAHQAGFSMRFLGNRFRTDNGADKAYAGPYFDISQTFSPVPARSDKAQRQKLFLFESTTQLLAKTIYQIQRGGISIKVETAYNGWSKTSDQAVPGQIVRTENGVQTFTIVANSAQLAATANDTLFGAVK